MTSLWGQLRPSLARATAVAVALVVVSMSGCGTFSGRSDGEPSPHAVLAVGFENLADRYIEQMSLDKAAVAGLERVAALDPDLAVTRSKGSIRLTVAGGEIAARPEPGPRDALGWAWLTADLIEAARHASERLRGHPIDDVYDAVFGGALSQLDPYTRYAGPAAARRARESREGFGGIGVTIAAEDGATQIVAVHENMPAEKAGVKRDDVITHVDGQPIKGVSQDDIVGKLRGPVGSQIKLTLTRKGQEGPIQLTIARAHVVPPTVVARRDGSILTLHITSFNQKTAASLARELGRANRDTEHPVTGIVLDLRGNPGGLLDQAVEVADQFLADGRIISTIGRHPDSNQSFDASSGEAGERLPLAVLINGRSASSAEIVAGALADRGRALVVGSTSFGKGTVQTIVRLPNSGEMTLTWSRIYTPSGRLLQDHGVVPSVCTADNDDRAAALLAALKARRATPALMTDRPAKGPETCPRDGETRASDAEIARRLLTDAPLYTAVLNTKRPAVAAR